METTAAAAAGEPESRKQDPEPGSVREALGSVKSDIQFLAGVDMTLLPGESIAELLTVMEQIDAGHGRPPGAARCRPAGRPPSGEDVRSRMRGTARFSYTWPS
jgi:hypothetical protein